MATFTICIRNKRSDGYYPVYIRIIHKSKIQYINTGFIVSGKGLKTIYEDNKSKIVVTDNRILGQCLIRIDQYTKKLNNTNSNIMSCKEIANYLNDSVDELSFTEYANIYIDKILNEGRSNSANGYRLAVSNLHTYLGVDNIKFNNITSNVIQNWITSMKKSARKKELYPTYIRAIFNSAIREHNNYDHDIIKIKTNPFSRIDIPKSARSKKKAPDVDIIKKILLTDIQKPKYEGLCRKEIAQDVSKIIFCLAGINAADLYDMEKSALKENWKLCYRRKKTRDNSETGSYTEITVPEIIRPLIEKYKGTKGKLFIFSERYSDQNDLARVVRKGLKAICEDLEITKSITSYSFRHAWATIAQNKCGASTELVAFCLIHSSAHKVTEGYIDKDYTPIDLINTKVIDIIFNNK